MTLVELLTAISITFLLLAVSIPVFIKQAKTNNVEASSRIVEEFINRARGFAFNPNKEFPTKYSVSFSAGVDGKSITGVILTTYNPITTPNSGSIAETIDQIKIPDVTITSGFPVNIDFIPVSGRVSGSLGMPMTLKAINNNDTKIISINSLGNVEVSQ